MSATQPFSSKNIQRIMAALWVLFFASCGVVPKNYPAKKPFVFKYNVAIEGNFSTEQKNELISRLTNQLDDSIRVRTARRLIYKGINRPVLNKPPIYDSINADKSIVFMRALLISLGYFHDTITYKSIIDTVDNDQYRTTINFIVKPGKVVRIDSFSYNIKQQELQRIALANQKESLLKKGEPFAKSTISVELDRLVDLYRNNGYLRFGREELIGLWDTLNPAILNPSLDPFEQILLLDSINKKRSEPTANLEIRLKPGFDSTKLIKYHIGNITVYPDYDQDTVDHKRKEVTVKDVKVIYYRNIFKPKIFPENIYLYPDSLYVQKNYFKTINRFNSLGSWRLVNIEPQPRKDQDTADFTIRLTPARKYSFTANLEGSRNQSAVSGNLFGIAVNGGLQNRNFARSANQTNTNVRYGIELSGDSNFVQTRQFVISHNIYFPRIIPKIKWIKGEARETFRTVFSFNAGSTQRKDLYDLTTLNGSWGYEFQFKKKFFTLRIPNVEFSNLKPKPQLDTLFKYNPALKNIFTDGFISSVAGGVTVNGGRNKNINVFRANIEESGLLTGLIHNKFLDDNLYRYIKADAEFTRKIVLRRSAIALRFFAGVGYELNSTVNPNKRNNLPFFKQYFAGGPNSMRAWGLRKLGPGSLVKEFNGTNGLFERYGDLQLETNIEWRFPIANISGVLLNGALFTDIGNVWLLKKQPAGATPEAVFNFSRLATDIAVGVGTGLRIDFSFFVVRLDYSYKAKDPSPSLTNAFLQNQWFGYKGKNFSKGTQFQLGINYPFIL